MNNLLPSLVALSQATPEINRREESAPPPVIECFKLPRSDRVKRAFTIFDFGDSRGGLKESGALRRGLILKVR